MYCVIYVEYRFCYYSHYWKCTISGDNSSQRPAYSRRKIFFMHRRHKFMSRWVSSVRGGSVRSANCRSNRQLGSQDGEAHQQGPRLAAPQAHEVWQRRSARPGGERELYRPLQSIKDTPVSFCSAPYKVVLVWNDLNFIQQRCLVHFFLLSHFLFTLLPLKVFSVAVGILVDVVHTSKKYHSQQTDLY